MNIIIINIVTNVIIIITRSFWGACVTRLFKTSNSPLFRGCAVDICCNLANVQRQLALRVVPLVGLNSVLHRSTAD